MSQKPSAGGSVADREIARLSRRRTIRRAAWGVVAFALLCAALCFAVPRVRTVSFADVLNTKARSVSTSVRAIEACVIDFDRRAEQVVPFHQVPYDAVAETYKQLRSCIGDRRFRDIRYARVRTDEREKSMTFALSFQDDSVLQVEFGTTYVLIFGEGDRQSCIASFDRYDEVAAIFDGIRAAGER